jgi:hypothetical protein
VFLLWLIFPSLGRLRAAASIDLSLGKDRSDPRTESQDGRYAGFELPATSGFVYKWTAPV